MDVRHCPVSNSRCKQGGCEWWTASRLESGRPIPMCALTLIGLCFHAELKLITAEYQEDDDDKETE
jgi:hypothetical protein